MLIISESLVIEKDVYDKFYWDVITKWMYRDRKFQNFFIHHNINFLVIFDQINKKVMYYNSTNDKIDEYLYPEEYKEKMGISLDTKILLNTLRVNEFIPMDLSYIDVCLVNTNYELIHNVKDIYHPKLQGGKMLFQEYFSLFK